MHGQLFTERETWCAMTSIRSAQQLGDALRAARKQLGLTQPELALAAGVGVRFIVDLEAGKPTLRLAERMLSGMMPAMASLAITFEYSVFDFASSGRDIT